MISNFDFDLFLIPHNKKTAGRTLTSGGFFFNGYVVMNRLFFEKTSINGLAIFYYFSVLLVDNSELSFSIKHLWERVLTTLAIGLICRRDFFYHTPRINCLVDLP